MCDQSKTDKIEHNVKHLSTAVNIVGKITLILYVLYLF